MFQLLIGGAFGKIITSLVGDVIMPPIGVALGGVDFSNLSIIVQEAIDKKPAVVISYGKFCDDHRLHHYRLCHIHGNKGHELPQEKGSRGRCGAGSAPNREVLLTGIRDLFKK